MCHIVFLSLSFEDLLLVVKLVIDWLIYGTKHLGFVDALYEIVSDVCHVIRSVRRSGDSEMNNLMIAFGVLNHWFNSSYILNTNLTSLYKSTSPAGLTHAREVAKCQNRCLM